MCLSHCNCRFVLPASVTLTNLLLFSCMCVYVYHVLYVRYHNARCDDSIFNLTIHGLKERFWQINGCPGRDRCFLVEWLDLRAGRLWVSWLMLYDKEEWICITGRWIILDASIDSREDEMWVGWLLKLAVKLIVGYSKGLSSICVLKGAGSGKGVLCGWV
jgi:hypothetical protein